MPSFPRRKNTSTLYSREKLLGREALCVLVVLAGLGVAGLLRAAPLAPPSNPLQTPAAVRAPWIFLWVQVMLRYAPAFVSGVIVPAAALVFLGFLPRICMLLAHPPEKGHISDRTLACFSLSLLLGSVLFLTLFGLFTAP